jgi:hypothetical protein
MYLKRSSKLKDIWTLLLPFILSTLPTALVAAECSTKSGATRVPLLELYTSEGCSSCPPADKWLSSMKLSADKVVPLAFHVDYWDYIGWKDKFSKPEFSARQNRNVAFSSSSFVYTPQFSFNGQDFRGWSDSSLNQVVENSLKQPSRANMTLDTINQVNGEIVIKATAQVLQLEDSKHSEVYIAIYENKLVSNVKAGENNGRELKHDYVVRDLLGAYQFNNKNEFSKSFTLKPEWKGRNAGVVIFVQNSQNGEILQSLQLPFCS